MNEYTAAVRRIIALNGDILTNLQHDINVVVSHLDAVNSVPISEDSDLCDLLSVIKEDFIARQEFMKAATIRDAIGFISAALKRLDVKVNPAGGIKE